MQEKEENLLYTVAPAGERGPALRVYGTAPPVPAELTRRLCSWLQQRKEQNHDSIDELGGGHPGGG